MDSARTRSIRRGTENLRREGAAGERSADRSHRAHRAGQFMCGRHAGGSAQLGLVVLGRAPDTRFLQKKPEVPDLVTAGIAERALRVPSHRVARALMEMSGLPIAAPSANRFSRPSPTTAAHVIEDLDGRIELILDAGPTDIGLESTIVNFTLGSSSSEGGPVASRSSRCTRRVPEVDRACGAGRCRENRRPHRAK